MSFLYINIYNNYCAIFPALIHFKRALLSPCAGEAVAKWFKSSWLVEQEDRGSIPGLATLIFRDWLSLASKLRYG